MMNMTKNTLMKKKVREILVKNSKQIRNFHMVIKKYCSHKENMQ
jgi:hypothetical protein